MGLYLISNSAMQTTAAPAVAAVTTIKTLIQVKPFNTCKIVEWGISFDASAAATPGKVELIETGTVPATGLTAYADADITKFGPHIADMAVASIAGLTLATNGTGFWVGGMAEGTITATRNLDGPQFIAPTNQFIKQFPLGREPVIQIGNHARIRATFGTPVNAYCYMIVEI